MIKLHFILLFIICGTIAIAQKPAYLFSVQPNLGYETNMLKSPGKYTSSDRTDFSTGELWKNAPFVGMSSRYMAYTKKKTHLFNFKGNYRKALFTKNLMVDASDMGLSGSYRYKNHKRIFNTVKIGFRNYVKTGEDQDNLLGIPLQYKKFSISDELRFKLNKKWYITTSSFSNSKFYNRINYNKFKYVDNGIKTSLEYRYKLKKKIGYALDLGIHQRNYLISKSTSEIEEDEEEEEDFIEEEQFVEEEELEESEEEFEETESETENRIWRYYSVGIGSKIPLGDKSKLTSRIAYTNRVDILHESFGYNQILLELGLTFKGKKWKTILNTSTYRRKYNAVTFSDQQAENENTEEENLLVYQYFKYSGNIKYKLTNQLDIAFRTTGKMRISNANNVNSKSMRSYFTTEFKGGIIWTIKKRFQAA